MFFRLQIMTAEWDPRNTKLFHVTNVLNIETRTIVFQFDSVTTADSPGSLKTQRRRLGGASGTIAHPTNVKMFMRNILLKDALLCFIGKKNKPLQSIIFVFIITCGGMY